MSKLLARLTALEDPDKIIGAVIEQTVDNAVGETVGYVYKVYAAPIYHDDLTLARARRLVRLFGHCLPTKQYVHWGEHGPFYGRFVRSHRRNHTRL